MVNHTPVDHSRSRMTETKRRREFEDQLRDADWTKRVSQGTTEGVCRAYTDSEHSETYLVWMHYSDEFNWWGIAEQKRKQLNAKGRLMHAFLGRQRTEWYLIPDKKIDELNLGKQSRHTDHYKIQIDHGDPPNREMLDLYAVYKGE